MKARRSECSLSVTDFKGWFRTGDGVRCEPFTQGAVMPSLDHCAWRGNRCRNNQENCYQ
jgi:hypothetical protein